MEQPVPQKWLFWNLFHDDIGTEYICNVFACFKRLGRKWFSNAMIIFSFAILCFFRLAHSEGSFTGGASQPVNNPDLVEDLSQVQQLQNESTNTAENTEQKPEEEVRWNNGDLELCHCSVSPNEIIFWIGSQIVSRVPFSSCGSPWLFLCCCIMAHSRWQLTVVLHRGHLKCLSLLGWASELVLPLLFGKTVCSTATIYFFCCGAENWDCCTHLGVMDVLESIMLTSWGCRVCTAPHWDLMSKSWRNWHLTWKWLWYFDRCTDISPCSLSSAVSSSCLRKC